MKLLSSTIVSFQVISAQRYGCSAYNADPIVWALSCGAVDYGNVIATNAASASSDGLRVTSFSPLIPNGISVLSENDISGILDDSGNLPVLTAVSLEGSLSTSGSAGTTYSCGSGQVGITSDSLAAAGLSFTGYDVSYSLASAGAASAATAANSCDARAFAPGTYATPLDFGAADRGCY